MKGVAYEISERSKIFITWNSVVLRREASYWPKNGLRSNLSASKFQKFSEGACPQTPLTVACLCTHYKPDYSKPGGYGPVLLFIIPSLSPSSSSDSPSLLDLARNLLALDIGEQLAPVLSEVESQCRERVYPAEEEYEGGRGRERERGRGRERERGRKGGRL